jgi:hypothetical protein
MCPLFVGRFKPVDGPKGSDDDPNCALSDRRVSVGPFGFTPSRYLRKMDIPPTTRPGPTGLCDRQSLGGPGTFGDARVVAFHDISGTPQLIQLAVLTTAGRNGKHEQ